MPSSKLLIPRSEGEDRMMHSVFQYILYIITMVNTETSIFIAVRALFCETSVFVKTKFLIGHSQQLFGPLIEDNST